ncbi:fatty acid desaturase [Oceaniovalibus sp. ACAM 378]|jgi:omega-6 fatty acid desaturase (delta-12 desaturase)|uniref:fatty acid desaturase n=1 Tax=Oceaniovalibus sp. ACAM 378 TaxID=2599923 RepID=UPI0011D71E60|nr:fatty acid desaturase [Oceaniovalibus sp. ACAM 378]TYB90647.1 fatty acid desaturase [Oceaniovalibus sp. ACAM 378]
MNEQTKSTFSQDSAQPSERTPARNWIQVLAKYRDPNHARSSFELAVSLVPFFALWALAWALIDIAPWASVALAMLNGGFLVRLFIIQHDCGHGGFFRNRHVSDWIGRALGVLTLTPYDVWRRTHAIHHSAAGNLDKRGIGDVHTLTVAEYRALSPLWRLHYRVYRHPAILFGLGPGYLFLLQNRLPLGLMRFGKYWASAMLTNLLIVAGLCAIAWFGGWRPLVLIFLPTSLVAASAGVWLFYVQHQFEETQWDSDPDWQLHDAALHGSSHYDLPPVLRWFSGNIGVHHVHHLYARIPFYRLTEVLRDHAELATTQRLTIRESLRCVRLHLWDEESRRLLSFRCERALRQA